MADAVRNRRAANAIATTVIDDATPYTVCMGVNELQRDIQPASAAFLL
jgi:hypothetical protein